MARPVAAADCSVIGVDVGQRYLATVATTNDTQFYCGKENRQQGDHYARLQKRLHQTSSSRPIPHSPRDSSQVRNGTLIGVCKAL
jgi:hypothetical protein